jgi:glutamyl-tRNA reductase
MIADWRLALCGINHKTATVEKREPFQINPDDLAAALSHFGQMDGIAEVAIVSTCNRVEFYYVGPRKREPMEIVGQFFKDFRGVDIGTFGDSFYTAKGKHAAQHLFAVCAGVDSMVVGENQIFGQVKDAYSAACRVGLAGKIIHRLFHQAFRVGKQVRSDTQMGRGACSVSSAAVELLKTRLDRIARPTVLFVGVNRMIELAAAGWQRRHHSRLLFANRTPEKALALAEKHRGVGYGLDELPTLLPQVDILFTCTGSIQPIVGREMIARCLAENPQRRLTIMDIAVPRDVEITKDFHPRVTLFDLDDVKQFVARRQSEREAAIPDAEAIIAERLQEFAYWYDHVRHEFTYDALTERFEAIKDEELTPILELLPSQYHRVVREAAERMAAKMAQAKLRASSGAEQSEEGKA